MAFRLGSAPLKRFYKYLLKRVIGSFLKRDIDLDQLEVQLWSGQVQLKNLELDVSSLNALPGLRCSAANLGCVKMVVPWRRLVSDHCKVYVSGLHLVFTKTDHFKAPSPEDDANPPGFFPEAAPTQEESRYTEEGIETLSRLVKRVLARMEVCLHDLSVTAQLRPCQLRGRLSSVLLLSEQGSDAEHNQQRSLRVGVLSLSMLPAAQEDEEPAAGEVTFLSTRGQESVTAAAGVLDLQINSGVLLSSLQLPAIRLAFTPISCCLLGETLSSLSQALKRPAFQQMPDIEDLEKNSGGTETVLYEEDPPPPMVQSLLFQSAMATGPGHFWQDLYSLFQADDELASAAAGDENMGAVEGENAAPDPQEEEAFLDVLEGEETKGPMVKISLKVQVGNVTMVLCFQEDQEEEELWSAESACHPQPKMLPVHAAPMQRPQHQGQLCLGGLSFSLDKKLTEPAEVPSWNFSADRLGLHLHQYLDGEASVPEEEAAAESAAEMPAGRSLATSDMFRSAFSELPGERPRTPSAPSEKCETEESEGEESESFGDSSVHSLSDATGESEEDEGGIESDEELPEVFFQASIRHLLPRRWQDAGPSCAGPSRGEWLRNSKQFLSKQVLTFIDHETGSSSGATAGSVPSPAPGEDHPIWSTLGFQGAMARRLWVATVFSGQARSLRFGCFPLQLSLCSTSIQLFHFAATSFRCQSAAESSGRADDPQGEAIGSPDRDASNVERPPVLPLCFVAPAIRTVLRLSSSTSLVGDLVLPRVLAPPGLPEEQDAAFVEALRFDAASAMLYLLTPEGVTDLLSLKRPAGAAPGLVHRTALELVILTRQAPSPAASSPKREEAPPEPSNSPPLTGWTRLTALRPSAPPAGSLHLPPATAELKEEPQPPESEGCAGGGSSSRPPVVVEMSVPGDVRFSAPVSKLCHLKQQAQEFMTSLRFEESPGPPAVHPASSPSQALGFRASLGRLDLRISEDQELDDSRGRHVTAVQLSLTSCHWNGSNFVAEDFRIDCMVQEGSREAAHTLLKRPSAATRVPERCGAGPEPRLDNEVTGLASYLWQASRRSGAGAPPADGSSLEGAFFGEALNVQLRGLVFLCDRALLEQCHWLTQLKEMFVKADQLEAAELPRERPEAETRSLSVRIQLMDCFVDLPSKSWSQRDGQRGTEVSGVKDPDPLVEDHWRMVLEVTSLEARIQSKARGSLRSGRLEAYVAQDVLETTDVLSSLHSSEWNLIGMGFVPFFEISSASCNAAKETEAELRLGRVHCHLRADTARALRRVADELSALLPAPEAVDMPEVVTQKAMPTDFDLGEDAFVGSGFATSSRFDETDNDILANVDMFAFAPVPRHSAAAAEGEKAPAATDAAGGLSDAMTDALQNALEGSAFDGAPLFGAPPELMRGSSASTTSSCRVDEFIRAQELQQSPRSPVRAYAPQPMNEGLGGAFEIHLEELAEDDVESTAPEQPKEEAEGAEGDSEVVAVCLFDPEVVTEQHLQKLYDEEAAARQQVEQQFHPEQRSPGRKTVSQKMRFENSCVEIFELQAEIIEDYFVRGELGNRRFEAPRWAPPPIRVLRVHLDELNLSVYEGNDFGPQTAADKDSLCTDRRSRSHLTVHLGTVEVKYMQFPATLPRGVGARKLVDSSTLRCRVVLGIRDFDIQDRVHQSVFSSLLASFEDDEKRPRPSMSDMLYFRVDELVHGTSDQPDAPKEVAPEYNVELQLLPLQLTVDQDTVAFLEHFWQMCSMSTYVEESDEDYMAQAGIAQEDETATELAELQPDPLQALNFATSPKAAAGNVPLFFQQVSVGSLLLSVDYKAKRIDVDALQRGELWQLVNLLPLLEGLQVHLRSVTVYHARGYEKVLSEVTQAWSADLNRTQLLRSLAGVTPIRSIANIGGGLKEMVLEPLKQYRAGEDAEHVSRTMLRGVISFLRHMTIESIDLTERVFLGAQAALEFANNRFTEAPAAGSRRPSTVHPPSGLGTATSSTASASAGGGNEWLPVERGSAHFMQPGGAAEGLQEAGSNFTRGLRNTGPFLVKPLLEIKQGASKKQVLHSVVSGIPAFILRPAIGVTSAAVPAIRGVRNRLDPSHRREMVRKYRGPG